MTKEESERRMMYKRYTKWVPGYYCYICAEPIDKGKLCTKHKGYFGDGKEENSERSQ